MSTTKGERREWLARSREAINQVRQASYPVCWLQGGGEGGTPALAPRCTLQVCSPLPRVHPCVSTRSFP
eukprot:scaffold49082_cov14-Tisochrysis_lutea.AAC.1